MMTQSAAEVSNQTTLSHPGVLAENLFKSGITKRALSPEFNAYWQSRVEQLEPAAQRLLDTGRELAPTDINLKNQMVSVARMLMLAKQEWEITEVQPGDCAGITYEQSSDEERIEARQLIEKAFALATEVQSTHSGLAHVQEAS